MGGGHDHHHAKIKIPDYKIYKVEDVPELMAVKRVLGARGLKDPWLRNEVWKYTVKGRGSTKQIFRKVLGRGFFVGLVAGAITAGLEKVWMAKMYPHHHHDDEGHDAHH